MRHDIADALILIIVLIFVFLGYNICQEVTDKKVQKLNNEIDILNKKVDSLQIVSNKQDTLFIKVYNEYNQKKK